MIASETVSETIRVYQKHGWVLRRLTAPEAVLLDISGQLSGVKTVTSDFGFAWFSRPPAAGAIAWEIRYLGEPPYALVEHLDENSPEFEDELSAVVARLKGIIGARRTA